MHPDQPATRLATRLAFLVAGFGVACWAPLVPFAKERLMVNDGVLGLLLLCLGVGSIVAMTLTGFVNARYGSKPMILAGCLGMTVILPLLPLAGTPLELGSLLFLFGASLGSLDVAMNIHAVEVERAAGRSLMSGFHGLYSVGGFVGAGFMTFLLSIRFGAFASTLTGAILMLIATAFIRPRLLRGGGTESSHVSVIPRGIVWLLSVLTSITFLSEGAVLDWSALLMTSTRLVTDARGGLGYMLFSIAMTAGRLFGDAVVGRIGDRNALFWGSILAAVGFACVAAASLAPVAMLGFILIGVGASNIVPVLFRRAGSQTAMPSGLAVAAISTFGYAGILVGPAAVGYVAKLSSLPAAFWMLAGLLCVVTLAARKATA
ncbi:MAG: MFS transporter [Proteobacteria bacterium]|nr:MFS transporter [Pseudomonadota bacterium]